MNFRAVLLFPFAFVNAIVLHLRHALFDANILKAKSAEIPIIKVGNLALGGTGKTPFTEYILHNFKADFEMGVVSRGYGRENHEIYEVQLNDSSSMAGDEPLQLKTKFPRIPIFLNSKRIEAIVALRKKYTHVNAIVLDDALQHRQLKGGVQILLSDFSKPFFSDWLFPSGYLRDLKSRAHFSHAIVITKILEEDFDLARANRIKHALRKYGKPVFFTTLKYQQPKRLFSSEKIELKGLHRAFLLTGIARSENLLNYLNKNNIVVEHLKFPDHYNFKKTDLIRIREKYEASQDDSVIFTTEKDAQRLKTHPQKAIIEELPIYTIGIEIKFLQDEEKFKTLIRDYVRKN